MQPLLGRAKGALIAAHSIALVTRAPFIVTSCNHAFCEKHRNDPKLQAFTCPGCQSHLSSAGGIRMAHYSLQREEHRTVMNGLTPDSALKVAAASIDFWVSQERNKLEYTLHKLRKIEYGREEQKAQIAQAYQALAQELESQKEQKEQSLAAQEDLGREVSLLKQKYQEEARRVHQLQETVIQLKRKRADSSMPSPARMGTPAQHGGIVSPNQNTEPLGLNTAARRPSMSPMRARPSGLFDVSSGRPPSISPFQPDPGRSPFVSSSASRMGTPDIRGGGSSSRFGGFNLSGTASLHSASRGLSGSTTQSLFGASR